PGFLCKEKDRSTIRWQHRLKRERPTCTERTEDRSHRVRMEGWRQWRLGRREKPCPSKKQKNPLDSDRPSHGRRLHSEPRSVKAAYWAWSRMMRSLSSPKPCSSSGVIRPSLTRSAKTRRSTEYLNSYLASISFR